MKANEFKACHCCLFFNWSGKLNKLWCSKNNKIIKNMDASCDKFVDIDKKGKK